MDENQSTVSSTNPLAKHFRQPSIYFKLPSDGRYWPQGAVTIPVTGELPVFPMTTKDEITLRTPDALMNGQGVVDVIHSCCPDIKDAWNMPSIDLDSTMISIRIASYGQEMEINSTCPKCSEEGEYAVDLTTVLDSIEKPNYDETVEANGLAIKLKPQTYFNFNKSNKLNFEEQQIMRTISQAGDLPEAELKQRFDDHLKKIIDINVDLLVTSTEYIDAGDTRVEDQNHLSEFYANADTKVIKKIQGKLTELSDKASIKPQEVTCANCSNQYSVTINFDYASFFAVGS